MSKGLRHLAAGQVGHRTTSRLERRNRELRRREQLGMVWTEYNLLALLPEQGLLNQTPETKRYPVTAGCSRIAGGNSEMMAVCLDKIPGQPQNTPH